MSFHSSQTLPWLRLSSPFSGMLLVFLNRTYTSEILWRIHMESIRRKRHVNSLKWTSLFFCEIQNLKRIGFYFNRLIGFLFHSSLYTLDYVCVCVYTYIMKPCQYFTNVNFNWKQCILLRESSVESTGSEYF